MLPSDSHLLVAASSSSSDMIAFTLAELEEEREERGRATAAAATAEAPSTFFKESPSRLKFKTLLSKASVPATNKSLASGGTVPKSLSIDPPVWNSIRTRRARRLRRRRRRW